VFFPPDPPGYQPSSGAGSIVIPEISLLFASADEQRVRNRLYRIFLAFLAAVLGSAASAGSVPAEKGGRLAFSLLGPDQGLPSGMVISMAQDAEGFLWFGTENGLYRYDGGHARRFTVSDGLPSGYIIDVLPAPDGGLWVSTFRGLVRFKDGRFNPVAMATSDFKEGPFLIVQDGRGRCWAANNRGVYVQGEGFRFDPAPVRPAGNLNAMTFGAASGSVHFATSAGITSIGPDGAIRTWSTAEGLPADTIHLVAEDGQGRLWAGSGRTLRVKEKDGSRFIDRSATLDRSLSPNAAPYLDHDGSLWLPTQDGAVHISGDRIEPLDRDRGLPFRWVRRTFRDREGTLWIAGPSVARMLGGERVWNYALAKGESGEIVWSILRGRDGRLLVGTDDGAARMENAQLVRIPGPEGRRIKAMVEDDRGTLWLTSTIGPTLWLKAGSPRAELAPLGEFGSSVHVVAKDSKGSVWIGHSRQGILRWDPASRRLIQEVGPAFFATPALAGFEFQEDRQGRLWAGTSSGLLVRDVGGRWAAYTERDGLRSPSVRGLTFLADGSAWIHYQEPSGLTRLRLDGSQLKVLEQRTRQDGLRSDSFYAVQAGPRGDVWASSDRGLVRLDPLLQLGRRDGMANEDCSIRALLVEGDQVWVGTAGGLVRFDNGPDPGRKTLPQAHLLQADFGSRRLEPPFTLGGPVPYREATAEFRFTAPEYRDEQDLHFQVRLVGLEPAWRDLDSRVARWPLLPGGTYRFEVRAAVGNGAFGKPAGLDFSVRPAWWRTWWAYASACLALVAAVLAFVRMRLASLARSKAQLEVQVANRTEELQTRNAELSSALGKVRQLSGLLPICSRCKKIRDDRGYWNQLEEYITEHSEAGFSHGICPDCIPLLYPELPPKP
jgi:ligand-binding sensor domain-containing protein